MNIVYFVKFGRGILKGIGSSYVGAMQYVTKYIFLRVIRYR